MSYLLFGYHLLQLRCRLYMPNLSQYLLGYLLHLKVLLNSQPLVCHRLLMFCSLGIHPFVKNDYLEKIYYYPLNDHKLQDLMVLVFHFDWHLVEIQNLDCFLGLMNYQQLFQYQDQQIFYLISNMVQHNDQNHEKMMM